MQLKELQPGQQFMFEDRKTPLAPAGVRGNYTAQGTFKYLGVAVDTCPRLLHIDSNQEITLVSSTYHRHVLVIF